MQRYLFYVVLSVVIAGCSGDPHADYVGVWQSSGNPLKTVEIVVSRDNYVFQDLRATTFSGEKEGPRAMSKQGTQLTLNNGLTDVPLALSDDRNTLIINGLALQRVPESDGQRLKQDIEAQRSEQQVALKQCESLRLELAQKEREIFASSHSGKEKLSRSAALKADIAQRASPYPSCKALLHLY
ncbi:hypothetical protein [Hydrogenophaga sp.]|uniref:hypothetical protein n=1 Tax=Hydrogenophaga sp. TaxID=1904254 RepID=UPI003F6EFFAD